MPTLNLGLPYIAAAQAQKHVTHNAALDLADALINLSVLSRAISAPPAILANGARYILPVNPTGIFAEQGGKIALYLNGAWQYVTPKIGWLAYIVDEAVFLSYNGTAWVAFAAGGGGGATPTQLQNLTGLGIGTSSSTNNPFSAQLNGALFTALATTYGGTGDMRFTLNKSAANNTVSQLYQTNYSGRAETGLTGDDHFHMKVSPDGSTWKEALNIDPVSGQVSLQYGLANLYGGFRNRLMNGNFDAWQAGTSFSVASNSSQTIADQWSGVNGASIALSFSKIIAPSGFRGQSAINATGTNLSINDKISFTQKIKGQMLADIDSGAACLSFDLNATTSVGTLSGSILILGNTALDNGTFSTALANIPFTAPNGAAVVSLPIPSSNTVGLKLGAQLIIQFTQTSAAGNANITLGAVQLEKGSVVNPFEFRPLAVETSLYQTASGGTGIASTVAAIPFATAIPLTQALAQYMPQQTVSSVLAFTLGTNPVQGSSVYLRLTADGINTLSFTGFKEFGGSLGYSNQAGTVNIIQFFYDGVDAFYSVSQPVYVAGAATGLALVGSATGSIGVASGAFTVSLLPAGSLASTNPIIVIPASSIAGTFTPSALTLSSTAIIGTFTFTPSASGAASISLTNNGGLINPSALIYSIASAPIYNALTLIGPTSGTVATSSNNFTVILSPSGGTAPASTIVTPNSTGGVFTPTSVTLTPALPSATFTFIPNSVGTAAISITNNQGLTNPASTTYTASAASTYIQFTPVRSMTQSGAGPFTYTSTGGGYGGSEGIAKSPIGFQNGVDGSMTLQMAVANNGDNVTTLWGVAAPATTVNAYNNLLYGLWTHGAGYQPFFGGGGDTASPNITPAVGDYMKLTRTGSTLTWSISQNSGSTWTVIKTYTGVPTTALSIYGSANTGGAFTPISSTGLA